MADILIVLIILTAIHAYHVFYSERRAMLILISLDNVYARLAAIDFTLDERVKPHLSVIHDELKSIDGRMEHFERNILGDKSYY